MTDLVWIDADYDRDNASDGIPRYGRYLRDRRHEFDEDTLSDPVSFASLAWAIATGPIMAPGYVRVREDIRSVTCRRDDSGQLTADIEVRVDHGALAGDCRPGWEWSDWAWRRGHLAEPAPERAVLLTAHVLVPFSGHVLHDPRGHGFEVDDARQAVATLVGLVNFHARDAVAALRGES